MQPVGTSWSLLTATGALMAFQVGLYTLVGRERKAPYVINSVFWLFLLALLTAAIDVGGTLLPFELQQCALLAGTVLLVIALPLTFYLLYRITIRFVYFIDDPRPKHWPLIRNYRAWRDHRRDEPTYSHSTVQITDAVKREISTVLDKHAPDRWQEREDLGRSSLSMAVEHQGQGNKILSGLCLVFIRNGYSVQYLTASRHPIEFITYLQAHLSTAGQDWVACRKQIVVIDAYTPHFGFIDSIYHRRSRDLQRLGITRVESQRTFAGMHTASSRAFNKIREQMGRNERRPTLVIYENTYALADLESAEQYRIFVRHVIPSERMWDGMFTVFLESAQPDPDWRVLNSYTSMTLDLRQGREHLSEATS